MHLFIINVGFYFFNSEVFSDYWQVFYINISWLAVAYFTKIYRFTRYTKVPEIVKRLFFQFTIFMLTYLSFYALTDKNLIFKHQIKYLGFTFLLVTLVRVLYLYALRKYRLGGYNFRKVVVAGNNNGVNPLIKFFNTRKEFGYKYIGYFNDESSSDDKYLGDLSDLKDFVVKNEIDEIYCSLSSISQEQIKEIIDFADRNLKIVKLVPDTKDLISKTKIDYYGFIPVLSIRKLPLEKPINRIYKRMFDIVFSFFVIVVVLSWLTPILYVLIKMESKGGLFFAQIREGLAGKTFKCYKFRSMGENNLADKIQTTKGDKRVTRIGAVLRKTSIDELPQFYNVLRGDMSVVGPRPHMLSQSDIFKNIVDKYMVRHFVKPGITGLAQVKGYRGEIVTDYDIINRIKYDIFYIENWNFYLDLKIIYLTIINAIKGEEKAY
jgi:putative colanic acid biosynthesis UDP-glucose lipid carrier transferase